MKIRVYYEDTDCGNVVYYANYLKYMERSRTEYLRDRGIELKDFHAEGIIFAVTEVRVKYRRSAVYNDILTVESTLSDYTSIALVFDTKIHNESSDLLVSGMAKLVCVDAKTSKACKIPQTIIEAIK